MIYTHAEKIGMVRRRCYSNLANRTFGLDKRQQ